MGLAEDAAVGGVVGAAFSAGDDVIVLEPGAALAAHTIRATPGATQAIAFDDGTVNAGTVTAGSSEQHLLGSGDGGCGSYFLR